MRVEMNREFSRMLSVRSSASDVTEADDDVAVSSCGLGYLTRSQSIRASLRRSKREPFWLTCKYSTLPLGCSSRSNDGQLLTSRSTSSSLMRPLRGAGQLVMLLATVTRRKQVKTTKHRTSSGCGV